ncbi:transposable element tc3 transposase [Plakobranchus ocellatus]|uniref:Transposable element tc3 transposase n=1 Tax=Plakobranchus ocellatus TaxID=259542 RepID=A0AAV4BXI3_9GAST|nr:transposable element tc3 transposase [Plakobranchus ocellatus]
MHKGHSGRSAVSENVVESQLSLQPKKSTRRCSQELQPPQRTVCKILRKCLKFTPYKLQLVQKLYPRDKGARFEFYHIVQDAIENDSDLLSKIIINDEANFHLSGKINRHSVRI